MHFCNRKGCPTPTQNNHYHCGRCDSSDVTSMMGHYRSDDGKTWYFTCKEKSVAVPMNFDGEEGYFVPHYEYDELKEKDEENERIEELEIENSNLREAISQAYDQAHELKALLGNA